MNTYIIIYLLFIIYFNLLNIHSLFTLPQFIYSLIRISIFFFFIQNVKANTVYLHTCDYNENDLNTHEQEWISKVLHTVQLLW